MTYNTSDFDNTEFESSVYARFPEEMRDYVKEALFYHCVDLQSGDMSFREFAHAVSSCAIIQKELQAQALKDEAMFEGVRQLVLEGKIDNSEIVDELTAELRQGTDSLLAKFISMQTLTSPLDAAISYLAWKRTKALFDLEDAFQVNLDQFRNLREAECFTTSEGNMALANFSVLSR